MLRGIVTRRTFESHTRSNLYIDGHVFAVIEPPWRDNRTNISCIPAGTYNCSYLPRSGSGKYKRVWHLTPVSNRIGILIHNGNLVSHTLGCLILGKRHGTLAGKPAVLASRTAMAELLALVGPNGFELEIWGNQYV